jgi:dienelactone hydrolase
VWRRLLALLLIGMASSAWPRAAAGERPASFSLPSPVVGAPSPDDQIWFNWYSAAEAPAPAVVLLHPLGARAPDYMRYLARRLQAAGISVVQMDLPYHNRRRPKGMRAGAPFISSDVMKATAAWDQAAQDVSAVVTWLVSRPDVDPRRIGCVGISLGAIVTHLAMGRDDRIGAGVAFLGGGDMAYLDRASLLMKFGPHHNRPLTPAEAAALRNVDPITYAMRNRPRHVLMVEAARDMLVPPRSAMELWKALGRPPIQWMDVNHFGLLLAQGDVARTTIAYLDDVWAGQAPIGLPLVVPPTIKFGMLMGSGQGVTPAIQWQLVAIGHRPDHMSLFHIDAGWSGWGPMACAGLTVTSWADIGMARWLNLRPARPYLSLHLVF